MNAMDLYEFDDPASGKTTPQPGAAAVATSASDPGAAQPSLEEEITQVVGQLGRFWGGFRKQSQSALEQARKEVTQVVTTAKGEINKFTSPPTSPERGDARTASTDERPSTPPPVDKGKQRELDPDGEASPTATPKPAFNTFFSRLQSSIPADSFSQTFQTLQKQIQPALETASSQAQLVASQAQQVATQAQQAAAHVDIGQIRSQLQTNIQRIQEQNAPLVAEYRKQSEAFIKDAQEYLKDAVKVVPPDEQGSVPGMTWDGTDVWMYPSPIGTAGWGKSGLAVDEAAPRKSSDTMTYARLSRAEALLVRLKHDPEMLKLDPREDASVQDRFEKYVTDDIEGSGGLNGEEWSKEIEDAFADAEHGEALKATHDNLVPSELSQDEFWHRYFFRVHQIQDEEEKRKALLQATTNEKDEDFSWEDDDEESVTSPKVNKTDLPPKATTKLNPTATPEPTSTSTTPTISQASAPKESLAAPKEEAAAASGPSSLAASPRESEESYDVLSPGVQSKDASSDDSDWE